jgi:MFS transporter, DHA2 family, multidrug resistance protein
VLTIGMGPVLIAAICGPILGGWLTDSFGWQSIFLINIPIGLLALVAAGLVLPEDDPSPAESLDIIGMSLLSAGVVLLLCGVSPLAGRGTIAGANAWFPATVGLVLLGAFVIHALRRADRTPIDLRLLRNRDVAATNAIRFPFAITFSGCRLLFPAYFQQVLSKAPLESGLLLIPQTLAVATVMPIAARLRARRGPRGMALAGTALTVIGIGVFLSGMSRYHVDLTVPVAGLAMFGAGGGCVMAPASRSTVHTLNSSEAAYGATLFNVNHNVAASFGATLLSAILTSRLSGGAVDHVADGLSRAPTPGCAWWR